MWIDRRSPLPELQFHPGGAGDPQQSIGARLAMAAQVGIQNRSLETRPACELSLGEATLLQNLSNQRRS